MRDNLELKDAYLGLFGEDLKMSNKNYSFYKDVIQHTKASGGFQGTSYGQITIACAYLIHKLGEGSSLIFPSVKDLKKNDYFMKTFMGGSESSIEIGYIYFTSILKRVLAMYKDMSR